MARLSDLREEAFCVLVESNGWSKTDAYEAIGHKRDRSNAAKFSDREEIAQRCREIRAERERVKALTGEQALRTVMENALQSGDFSPAVAAARAIAEADLSLQAIRGDKPMTLTEMLGLAREIGGVELWVSVAIALMLLDPETGKPLPPWTGRDGRPVPPYIEPETGRLVE